VRPIETCRFMRLLFEDEAVADQAAEIGQAILAARSLRMEKMLVLLLLVYAVAFLIGERLRDVLYSEPVGEKRRSARRRRHSWMPAAEGRGKWKRYSGLFVLLKQKGRVSPPDWAAMVEDAW